MHEASLALRMVEILEEQARAQHFERVRRVFVEIGRLSHVEPEALRFGFEAASLGTIAEGAELTIEEPPGRAHCMDWEGDVEVGALGEPCPACGSHRWLLTAGDEMKVRELEVV